MNKHTKNSILFRLGNRFLNWFCDPILLPEIEGDLHELYHRWKIEYGAKKAQWLFFINVITFLRPFAVRKRRSEPHYSKNHIAMFQNYLKIAFRNLRKQKAYSVLNILGLSLGVACTFLIAVHINDELSYESNFPKHDRIHRVSLDGWARGTALMGQSMEENMPEIQSTARFYYMYPKILRYNDFQAEVDHGYMADSTVFSMFDFRFIQGNPQQAFLAPYSMVITESMAQQYFGNDNPVGQTLINENTEFHITGVIADLLDHTHLKVNFLVSMTTFYKEIPESWTGNRWWMSTFNYILLHEASDIDQVKDRMSEVLLSYYDGLGTPEEILENVKWSLIAVDDIHLHSKMAQEMVPSSDITYVYIFAVIGVFILLIASINFINIFTTQSLKRMKEVGVRRVIGAGKNQLLGQFLGEALLVTLIASVLAVLLFELVLPFYNQLAGKHIHPNQLFSTTNMLIGLGIMIMVSLLSGLYPAFFVSGFPPLKALAGIKNPRSSAGFLRKSLLVFQFVVAAFMIASTIVVYQQMQYFHSKDLGFNKDQVVAVSLFDNLRTKLVDNPEATRLKLTENPDILNVAVASNLPGDGLSLEVVIPDETPEDREIPPVNLMRIDENYLPALQIDVLEGRNFSRDFNDSSSFIINETAAKLLNIENPVGSYVTNQTRGVHGQIVGIIKDYHFSSLHNPVEPLVLEYNPSSSAFMVVKLKGGKIRQSLTELETKIHELVPDYLFNYQFLDDRINLLYQDEAKMSTLFKFFAAFAILIACLGLFGLSAHASEVRTKEVAIRKTIGATITQIVQLLSKDFMGMVILGNIIAWPLSWWAMQRWLENFSYHISIHWSVFVAASILTVLVAIGTVSYHAIRTALANPVNSLRSE